jgi:hypothetical protein
MDNDQQTISRISNILSTALNLQISAYSSDNCFKHDDAGSAVDVPTAIADINHTPPPLRVPEVAFLLVLSQHGQLRLDNPNLPLLQAIPVPLN